MLKKIYCHARNVFNINGGGNRFKEGAWDAFSTARLISHKQAHGEESLRGCKGRVHSGGYCSAAGEGGGPRIPLALSVNCIWHPSLFDECLASRWSLGAGPWTVAKQEHRACTLLSLTPAEEAQSPILPGWLRRLRPRNACDTAFVWFLGNSVSVGRGSSST